MLADNPHQLKMVDRPVAIVRSIVEVRSGVGAPPAWPKHGCKISSFKITAAGKKMGVVFGKSVWCD